MAINFNNALGIHPDALLVHSRRSEIIANNIANADTPNFKARDIDFRSILAGEQSALEPVALKATKAGHFSSLVSPDFAADLLYRQPLQPSIDGNTVEVQEEIARFTENSIRFQASFEFLNSKFSGLNSAIKGE
ncbi:flagellar basal body rod protein FlgB [Nitrincola alkalilacustris]|uniref:flagellar basal body rod protein FlgB n=1 Tax=Nitrincola alkalilacustris TaxID=1571224 RepID=UPI00124F3B40|nr:flagellar basal body rod protein FlgB [Nitrincola alkalilacustris]